MLDGRAISRAYLAALGTHTISLSARKRQLLLDPNVLFAGYRLPHPQDNKVEIRIQTDPNMNPYVSPRKALSNACIAIVNQCRDLRKSFEEQADVFDVREQAGAGGVNGGGFGAGAGVQAGRDGYGQPIGAGYDGYLGGGMGGGQADDPYAY